MVKIGCVFKYPKPYTHKKKLGAGVYLEGLAESKRAPKTATSGGVPQTLNPALLLNAVWGWNASGDALSFTKILKEHQDSLHSKSKKTHMYGHHEFA
jgi:hypothetical protein